MFHGYNPSSALSPAGWVCIRHSGGRPIGQFTCHRGAEAILPIGGYNWPDRIKDSAAVNLLSLPLLNYLLKFALGSDRSRDDDTADTVVGRGKANSRGCVGDRRTDKSYSNSFLISRDSMKNWKA